VNNSERNWRHGRLLRYLPFILCIGIILLLSTSEGSAARTSLYVRPILRFLFPETPEITIALYHSYIRKSAHLFEYAVLGLTASRAFHTSSRVFLHGYWFVAALLSVVAVASIDEAWQSLNPARTGAVSDVGLDLLGGMIGVTLFAVSAIIWKRTKAESYPI
jgi:VanZ family protein